MPIDILEMIKRIPATILFLLIILVFAPIQAEAGECPHCHAEGISTLQMNCPECGQNLHDPALKYNALQKSELTVRLLYTGQNPERMPPYGKLFVNGVYHGNIDMVEKEVISKDFHHSWSDGLGKEYTAVYEKNLSNIPSGVLKIEVQMRFDRFYGLGRSYKKVVFPYVSFKPGEKTTVSHRFKSAATFHQYKPEAQRPLPVVSEMKLQGASGTVALNVPLFY